MRTHLNIEHVVADVVKLLLAAVSVVLISDRMVLTRVVLVETQLFLNHVIIISITHCVQRPNAVTRIGHFLHPFVQTSLQLYLFILFSELLLLYGSCLRKRTLSPIFLGRITLGPSLKWTGMWMHILRLSPFHVRSIGKGDQLSLFIIILEHFAHGVHVVIVQDLHGLLLLANFALWTRSPTPR